MPFISLLISILVLIFLIIKKVNPMLALIGVSVLAGLLLRMPVASIFSSINNGIGSTLSSTVMVIALGAMIGKLAEESGAARKLVAVFTKWFGVKNIQWGILITGLLAGIPLFYNAGFVVLIPLVFAIAKDTKLPLLYVGLPMAASLSVTHGFLPPHPGPVALASILHANIGKTLLYGLVIAIPTAVVAGVLFSRLISTEAVDNPKNEIPPQDKKLPSTLKSFLFLLFPVLLITIGTVGVEFTTGAMSQFFTFLEEPTMALLLSLALSIILLDDTLSNGMLYCAEAVKSVALIILIIAAGGAFKQIIVDSHIGNGIEKFASSLNLSPLFLGWLIAAIFRVVLGSATVAGLTASALVLPILTPSVSPELMVLSVGAGSLMCSHVNDTGFWMFKEYFGLTIKQTFLTWTIMESLISILGLAGVLLLNVII